MSKKAIIKQRNRLPMFLCFAALLIFPACGGKGPLPASDTTPPKVVSTSPALGSSDVPPNTSINVTFNKPVNEKTIQFVLTSDATGTVPCAMSFNGTTATFTPLTPLAYSTQYFATVAAGVTDQAGNAMPSDYPWSFTTGTAPDTTPPLVSDTTPTPGATNVAVNAAVSITFSEPMDPSTISSATITLTAGTASVSGTISYSGTTAIFTPANTLSYSTLYTVTVSTGAKDLAGNALAGNMPNGDYQWTFTTGTAPDITPPVVFATTPISGATDVAVKTAITVTFSEPVDERTIDFALLSAGTTTVPCTMVYSGTTATFTPVNDLSYDILYTAIIKAGVQDLAKNGMLNDYIWNFLTARVTTGTAISAPPVSYGLNGIVTVTVSAGTGTLIPTGTVSLTVDGVPLTPLVLDSNGQAIFTVSGPGAGSHPLIATYTPTGIFQGSLATGSSLTVQKAVLTVTADNKSKNYGDPNPALTFVYSGFVNGDTASSALTGSPALSTTATATSPAGTYAITAAIGTLSAANYTFSFVDDVLTVNKATTSVVVTSNNNPSTFESAVDFTVTVSPSTATGTVTFKDGSTVIGTVSLTAGTAILGTAALSVGSHSITAVYSGDLNFEGSTSSSIPQTVNQSPTATIVLSSLPTSTYGDPVAFTATVTPPMATGIVTFLDGGTSLGSSVLSSGTATFVPPSLLSSGTHTITAVYSGDVNYLPSGSSGITQTVNKAVLTVTANDASRAYGAANPPFTASYSGFVSGETASVLTGSPSLTTTADATSPAGTYPIIADVSTLSAANYSFNSVNGTLTIGRATTTTSISSDTTSLTSGAPVTFTAIVISSTTGTPTGTVTFTDTFSGGTSTLETVTLFSDGTTTLATSALVNVGDHSITAQYNGDTNFAISTSATLTLTVNP